MAITAAGADRRVFATLGLVCVARAARPARHSHKAHYGTPIQMFAKSISASTSEPSCLLSDRAPDDRCENNWSPSI
jgi:hypothetical protein